MIDKEKLNHAIQVMNLAIPLISNAKPGELTIKQALHASNEIFHPLVREIPSLLEQNEKLKNLLQTVSIDGWGFCRFCGEQNNHLVTCELERIIEE